LQFVAAERTSFQRSGGGTLDALTTVVMKDITFVAVTAAFFWVSWIYAKSFDRL
jgi:hypothetical protein